MLALSTSENVFRYSLAYLSRYTVLTPARARIATPHQATENVLLRARRALGSWSSTLHHGKGFHARLGVVPLGFSPRARSLPPLKHPTKADGNLLEHVLARPLR